MRNGFNLVELMVVILIIAILAAIALPMYTSYNARSRWGQASPCVTTAALALENSRTLTARYPTEFPAGSGSLTFDCPGEFYEGRVILNPARTRFVVVVQDTKRGIYSNPGDDAWAICDRCEDVVHFRNPVGNTSGTFPAGYSESGPPP